MRRLVLSIAVLLAASVAAGGAAAAGSGKPPGFKVTLRDGQRVECSYFKPADTLQCLNYTLVAEQQCQEGTAIPVVNLRPKGKPEKVVYCITEDGYHGWRKLKRGGRYKQGSISCRLSPKADALRCSNKSGTAVIAKAAAKPTT